MSFLCLLWAQVSAAWKSFVLACGFFFFSMGESGAWASLALRPTVFWYRTQPPLFPLTVSKSFISFSPIDFIYFFFNEYIKTKHCTDLKLCGADELDQQRAVTAVPVEGPSSVPSLPY